MTPFRNLLCKNQPAVEDPKLCDAGIKLKDFFFESSPKLAKPFIRTLTEEIKSVFTETIDFQNRDEST